MERKCRNCGAALAPDERTCPSCGRLAIDRRASRLGSDPHRSMQVEDIEARPASSEDTSSPPEAKPASAGDSEEPESGPKPSSFYAVAPMAVTECPNCGASYTGSKCKQCGYKRPKTKGGCCSCAVVLGLITWLMTLVFVL